MNLQKCFNKFMNLSFKMFEPHSESDALVELLTSQSWPFHAHPHVSEIQIRQSIQDGNYSGESNQTFWILHDNSEKIGIIKIFEMDDLDDGAPLFDIRILNKYQGNGVGQAAVKWLTSYLFTEWPLLSRIEGTTRIDNIKMRKVFLNCGYEKEGHYRKSWPAENNSMIDTVRYSILRTDWLSGSLTPVNWLD